MGKPGNSTFQQVIQTEWNIVPCFFGFVQAIYIQQVVKQMGYVPAYYPYVVQMIVTLLLVTGAMANSALPPMTFSGTQMSYDMVRMIFLRISSSEAFCFTVSSRRLRFFSFSRISRWIIK